MSTPPIHGTFEVRSPRLAALTIRQAAPALGLLVDRRQQHHQVGLRAAPLFRLAQPLSPDDAWQIEPLASGERVPAAWAPAPDDALAARYAAWAAGSRARVGHGLIALLPAGRYLLVRSPRRPLATDKVLLGNEWVPARPSLRVLADQPPVYALVAGADPATAPALDQPLLGVPVLNYVGEAWMHAVLFFELAAPAPVTNDGDGDPILVVPVDGELVFDNLAFFSAEAEQQARAAWRDREAEAFARWCAGENDDPDGPPRR